VAGKAWESSRHPSRMNSHLIPHTFGRARKLAQPHRVVARRDSKPQLAGMADTNSLAEYSDSLSERFDAGEIRKSGE